MSARRIGKWLADAAPYEALSLALQMEMGAVRLYAAMARAAKDRLSSAKFRYLAEEERGHARLLAAARKAMARPERAHRLPAALSEVEGLPEDDSPEASVRLAIRAEKNSEKFYSNCAARCRKPDARNLFNGLAAQESRHARLLQEELVLLGGGFAWRSLEGTPPPEDNFWA